MKSLLKVLLAGIFLFGSVPTLQASSDAGMEEIKKKKKKKGKKVKNKEKGKKGHLKSCNFFHKTSLF